MDQHKSGAKSMDAGVRQEGFPNSHRIFLVFNILYVLVLFRPLLDLAFFSWRSEYFSYIPFIPFICAYLMYSNRRAILSQYELSVIGGITLTSIALLTLFMSKSRAILPDQSTYLAVATFSMISLWIGGFLLSYGPYAMRTAAFPLAFLFFAVPIPNTALDAIIGFLQAGSANISYYIIRIAGIPVARDGFVFHMPQLNIEVARQCSGIRSSLSLVITTLLAGSFFLRSGWSRVVLMLAVVPIAILKNGIRIAALTIIGFYIDGRILDSDLHKNGGIIFFILALLMAGVVVLLLRRVELKYATFKEQTSMIKSGSNKERI